MELFLIKMEEILNFFKKGNELRLLLEILTDCKAQISGIKAGKISKKQKTKIEKYVDLINFLLKNEKKLFEELKIPTEEIDNCTELLIRVNQIIFSIHKTLDFRNTFANIIIVCVFIISILFSIFMFIIPFLKS